MSSGPTFSTPAGVVVIAAYRHNGAARKMVHGLKYHGLNGSLVVLADAMAARLPAAAEALVPVRRARLRRWRHGVDPAFELARAIGHATHTPVADVLRAPLWWPRHAGRRDELRGSVGFAARAVASPKWVLVDDVATTGSTIDAAAAALGQTGLTALVATAPSRVGRTLLTMDRPASLRPGSVDVPATDGLGQAMSRGTIARTPHRDCPE